MKKLMTLGFVAVLAFGAVSCNKTNACTCSTTSVDPANTALATYIDSTLNAVLDASTVKLTSAQLKTYCEAGSVSADSITCKVK